MALLSSEGVHGSTEAVDSAETGLAAAIQWIKDLAAAPR
jgi:hypothetical protein